MGEGRSTRPRAGAGGAPSPPRPARRPPPSGRPQVTPSSPLQQPELPRGMLQASRSPPPRVTRNSKRELAGGSTRTRSRTFPSRLPSPPPPTQRATGPPQSEFRLRYTKPSGRPPKFVTGNRAALKRPPDPTKAHTAPLKGHTAPLKRLHAPLRGPPAPLKRHTAPPKGHPPSDRPIRRGAALAPRAAERAPPILLWISLGTNDRGARKGGRGLGGGSDPPGGGPRPPTSPAEVAKIGRSLPPADSSRGRPPGPAAPRTGAG